MRIVKVKEGVVVVVRHVDVVTEAVGTRAAERGHEAPKERQFRRNTILLNLLYSSGSYTQTCECVNIVHLIKRNQICVL